MKISRKQLANIVADEVGTASSTKKVSKAVAAFLIQEHKTSDLPSLLRDIEEDWAKDGYVNLVAVSAHPLNSEIKQDIKKQVQHIYPKLKKVFIEQKIDSAVLSGVRLELANYQLDLTAQTKLDQLKQLTA